MRIASSADAITAGRLGLWLLSRRQHAAAKKRIALPTQERLVTGPLIWRIAAVMAPWRISEYPGTGQVLAAVCGASYGSVRHWLCDRPIPARYVPVLVAWLRARGSQCMALASELEAVSSTGNLARNVAPAAKVLTNGANGGPGTFARAEPTQAQVNAEIFNAAASSPQASQTAKPSKKFGAAPARKAKRKTRR